MKKTVIIIGLGFVGSALIDSLRGFSDLLDIKVIDEKDSSDFLPLLPDIIGRRINPEYLRSDSACLCKKAGVDFIKGSVLSVDLKARVVMTSKGDFKYDFLVIASGSQTNFYGNNNIESNSCKLDSVDDAVRLLRLLEESNFKTYIIAGAGYTGIEVATNLSLFLHRRKLSAEIILVERAPSVLGMAPDWMKDYVLSNLSKMGIKIMNQVTIEKIEAKKVSLSAGITFDNALVIWSAGVRTADFIQNLPVQKSPQGRIQVDEYLRLNENCFVAGDASYVLNGSTALRMAVQFSITQAVLISKNIINAIKSRSLIKYKPVDLGFIIPMANNAGCGSVFGVNIKGLLSVILHYTICIYRSRGISRKVGIVFSLLKGGG